MPILKCIIALSLVLMFESSAHAKVTQQTSYSYFKVNGQTAREIYQSLIRHAKGPRGHDAYATTDIKVFQDGALSGKSPCRTKNFNLRGVFQITLPKLTATPQSPTVQSAWTIFSGTLRSHEEHHRALWMSCVTKFEAKAKAMTASSCPTLKAQLQKTWSTMQANCKSQNDRFDAQEQVNLLRQPFIRLVAQP